MVAVLRNGDVALRGDSHVNMLGGIAFEAIATGPVGEKSCPGFIEMSKPRILGPELKLSARDGRAIDAGDDRSSKEMALPDGGPDGCARRVGRA